MATRLKLTTRRSILRAIPATRLELTTRRSILRAIPATRLERARLRPRVICRLECPHPDLEKRRRHPLSPVGIVLLLDRFLLAGDA
jgi:hypothetical protein